MRITLFIVTLIASASVSAQVKISDLSWMKGHWGGAVGNTYLEETWTHPRSGTMTAAVRMTAGETTVMNELIIIAEENDTLVLRLRQFDTLFEPRTGVEVMEMVSMTENSVHFKAIKEGGLQTITYTRPTESKFKIEVLLTEGTTFVADLEAVQ